MPPPWRGPAPLTASQGTPPARATADGPRPTATVRTTRLSCERILTTVPPRSFATHASAGVAATATGPFPTPIVAVTAARRPSIRDTVPSRLFATHTSRPAAATPA